MIDDLPSIKNGLLSIPFNYQMGPLFFALRMAMAENSIKRRVPPVFHVHETLSFN